MELSSKQRRIIESVINVFETGTADGDYAAISIYHDGPHDIRQITYGRSQTTEFGHLRTLVAMYVAAAAAFSAELAVYADRVGSVPLVDDTGFKTWLRRAGREDSVMRDIQDRFFAEVYFEPAMAWADDHGFSDPLSALVIYDSFIHSGGILWLLRVRFPESPPSRGGDERTWVAQYVRSRGLWLSQHHRAAVRRTVSRTDCLRREIERGNWSLAQLPIRANGVAVA